MTTLNLRSNFKCDDRRHAQVLCSHCQTPVPSGMVRHEGVEQFCCEGCRTVFQVIRSCGLNDFYSMRDQSGAVATPVQSTSKGYEEFDDPAFYALYCTGVAGGLQKVDLLLENIHCGACVWLIERLPLVAPAVVESRLDFGKHVVHLIWNPQRANLSSIAQQLASLGYPPHPAKGGADRALRRREDRSHLIRIAVAGAIAGNMMIIAFALYGGMFHGMEKNYERLFHWTSLLLMSVSVLGPGRVFFRGALAAWRAGTMHMDVPISIGLAAGSIWSAINVLRGSSEIYFDSLSILVFLLLLGRWIQLRQQRRSRDAVELLYSMTPGTARLVEDHEGQTTREVPVQALRPGQIVEVRAGDSVPVDGVVVRGASIIDASLLTGESRGVSVNVGDRVHAGTVNLASVLRVAAESIGEATRVGKLMQLVEQSASRRAPVVRLADRIAGVFVIIVLSLAAITFALWLWLEPAHAMKNAMALLIVTCPCALGMATPLAIIASIGKAARSGILIRGGEVVEQLNRPGLLLLDKTGTITEGAMKVVEWIGPESLKPIVAAIETHSSHPLAQAIAKAFTVNDEFRSQLSHVSETTGFGIQAVVHDQRVLVGSRPFLEMNHTIIPSWARESEQSLAASAITPILISVDGHVLAIAGIGDPIKSDAPQAIAALQCAGWKVGILSGDHETVVAAVARQLGINPAQCRGRVTPEKKLAAVQQELLKQPVMMVGDGVNDAAALAAATVGVAVKGGAEASFAAADVYLNRPGLAPLASLVIGSRRTFNVIRRNLAVSLLYNVVGVSLAMAGVLNPLIAAIIMPISSLSVITLSYRSRTFKG